MQSCRWCVTLNNPTDEEKLRIAALCETIENGGTSLRYAIVAREVGESGTPHLQCFFYFTRNRRLAAVRALLSHRIHAEVARGTVHQNRDYCTKDGDYDEFGILPSRPGTGGAFDRYKDWVCGLEYSPSEREIARAFPGLYVRYSKKLVDLSRFLRPLPVLVPPPPVDENGTPGAMPPLFQWQDELQHALDEPPDDRKIYFVVDVTGGKGKSWFTRYYWQMNPSTVQFLGVGKRDDMAHAVDETKTVFFINVPRGSMEFLQYSVLEMLKDRVVYSPKYNSCTKILRDNCHVCVMSNEHPDMNSLSGDRYEIMEL